MRELRYVKQPNGGAHSGHLVLETTDGGEQFLLGIDIALRDAVRSDLLLTTGGSGAEPKIGPREIQVRVRSGESPQRLAEAHGASLEWIMRFGAPVLAERTRIADEARRGRARRSTTEGQSVVFGEAVDERFAAHGLDPAAVRWDAHRREDGQWVVSAHWPGGESEQSAAWTFQLAGRAVAPIDDAAADLLSDQPIRPSAPGTPVAPQLAPGIVAFPDLADAHTGRLPLLEDELFDQDAVTGPPAEEADDAATAEPALPLHLDVKPRRPTKRRSARLTNLGVAGRADEPKPHKTAREPVPSWDDILLGVRRKQD